MTCEERQRELDLFGPGKRRHRGMMTTVFQYTEVCEKVNGDQLFFIAGGLRRIRRAWVLKDLEQATRGGCGISFAGNFLD